MWDIFFGGLMLLAAVATYGVVGFWVLVLVTPAHVLLQLSRGGWLLCIAMFPVVLVFRLGECILDVLMGRS